MSVHCGGHVCLASIRYFCSSLPITPTHLFTSPVLIKDAFFTPFEDQTEHFDLPAKLTFQLDSQPHAISLRAARMLQSHLETQQQWRHNFGLSGEKGNVIGKMFGVIVVRNKENELGYLAAFSGKLAGGNHHAGFVPPIFDGLTEGSFLNAGMTEISRMNDVIQTLGDEKGEGYQLHIKEMKLARQKHSMSLQNEIFDQYHFLNRAGERRSLRKIFADASYKNPPAGAGECAAPKLLQYAFSQGMMPISIAEFWWGLSPKSDFWKHGQFYPACREKCGPILGHMLSGMGI